MSLKICLPLSLELTLTWAGLVPTGEQPVDEAMKLKGTIGLVHFVLVLQTCNSKELNTTR